LKPWVGDEARVARQPCFDDESSGRRWFPLAFEVFENKGTFKLPSPSTFIPFCLRRCICLHFWIEKKIKMGTEAASDAIFLHETRSLA
jgi:hypothetical protein